MIEAKQQLKRWIGVPVCASLVVLAAAGCHISSRGKDGKEDVDISTPLGGFAVKTDPSAVLSKLGLPQYPGSNRVQDKDSNKDSADVNMSFGSFHLRVLAAAFQTGDDRDKVESYYRKALQQYSDVITCEGEHPVGEPTKTGLGLTCKSDKHVNVNSDDDKHRRTEHERVLKAGSPSRQHFVTLEERDGGTRFSLVALDLPKGDDNKDKD